MEEIGGECAVCSIYLKDTRESSEEVPYALTRMLSAQQHRGQKSSGICVYNPLSVGEQRRKIIVPHKGVGRVSEIFKIRNPEEFSKITKHCRGIAGIGHNRYSTSGFQEDSTSLDETQPFVRRHPRSWKRFAVAFNGNIVNGDSLRSEMEKNELYTFDTEVDTEVLMNLMALSVNRLSKTKEMSIVKPDMFDVTKGLMEQFDGSYNVVSLFGDGDLLVFRDVQGFRPLVFGENEKFYAVASESIALQKVGIDKFRDIEPGEAVVFNKEGFESRKLISEKKSFCHFEDVYFSKSISVHDGRYVSDVRQRLGKELAKTEPLRDKFDRSYIVVPVPKTAITAAEAYAEELNLQTKQAIEKIDEERGFINGKEERDRIMGHTYVVHPYIKGRKIIVVEDSIVRGETFASLFKQLAKLDISEIHLRITEPPIKYPCFYGIDFPSQNELIAHRLSRGGDVRELEERIAREFGIDSVHFQTIEGLVEAEGIPENELCLACLTGKYPTAEGQRKYDAMKI